MPVIFSLIEIPSGVRFHIHDFMGKAPIIKTIAAVAVPDSTCISVQADLAECVRLTNDTSDCVISCDPQAYFSGLWRKQNFFFIPATERNATSFWHFGYIIFSNLYTESGRVRLQDYVTLAAAANILAAPAAPADPDTGFRRKHHPYFRADWVRSRLKDIHLIHHHLSDQNSRDAFMRYMYCDPLAAFDYFLSGVLRKTQYFDYLQLTAGQVIINCGVDNGWELPFFLAATGNSTQVYNLDPSGDADIAEYTRLFVDAAPQCFSFHKVAVWDRDTKLTFSKRPGGIQVSECGSNAAPGETFVDAVSIDSFCATHELSRVDVIKMDIEGAEPEAVRGMIGTVKRYRPQLAIAIYHDESQAQALDIPVAIIESAENYNFYLDTYNFDLGESIFYAIPREKDRRKSDCFVIE